MVIEICIPMREDMARKAAIDLNVCPNPQPTAGWNGAHFNLRFMNAVNIRSRCRGEGMDCLSVLVEIPIPDLIKIVVKSVWYNYKHL